jgi:hypothetical protein
MHLSRITTALLLCTIPLLWGQAAYVAAQDCTNWLERDLSVGEVINLRSRPLTLVVRGSHSYLWRYLADESGPRGWLQTTGSVTADPGDELILVATDGTSRTFILSEPIDASQETAKTLAFPLTSEDLQWLRSNRVALFKWKSLARLEIREYRLSEMRQTEFSRLSACVAARLRGVSRPADTAGRTPSGPTQTPKGGAVDLKADYERAAAIKAELAREVTEARAAAAEQQQALAESVRVAQRRSDERLAEINAREIERIQAARARADSILRSLSETVASARSAAQQQLEADQSALAASMAALRERNEAERQRMQEELAKARNEYAAAVAGARDRADQAISELNNVENLSQEERNRRLAMIQTETDRALILAEAQKLAAEEVAETRRRALQAVTAAQEKADARLQEIEKQTARQIAGQIARLEKTLEATAATEAAALARAQTAEAEAEARITRARLRAEKEIDFLKQQVAEALAARDAARGEGPQTEAAEARLVALEQEIRAAEAELARIQSEIAEARRLLKALRGGNQ